MIAVPLLTLVPGGLGGSETYVRELLASLAAVGGHEYRVILPPIAPDAAGPLPSTVARAYRPARTTTQRLAAMTLAALRPGPLRESLAGADAVHFPLTIELPRTSLPTAVTLHDVQHLDLPELFSRGERAFRAVTWHRSLRRADIVIAISDFVRERAVERLELDPSRVRVTPLGLDHVRFSPGGAAREPFLLYPARPWRHKNHERLFEAFTLLRRERPELRLVLTGGGSFGELPTGVEARGQVALDERRLTAAARVRARLPVAVRGLRPAAARGDGVRLPRRLLERSGAARGRRRRRAPLRPDRPRVDRRRGARRARRDPALGERGLARAQQFSWEETARPTDAVYRELSTRS